MDEMDKMKWPMVEMIHGDRGSIQCGYLPHAGLLVWSGVATGSDSTIQCGSSAVAPQSGVPENSFNACR